MSKNNLNIFSLGCLIGSWLFYKQIKQSIEENNNKISNEINLIKKSLNFEIIHFENKLSNSKNIYTENNTKFKETKSLAQMDNNLFKNDLIFNFLIKAYFPEGPLILIFRMVDISNNNIEEEIRNQADKLYNGMLYYVNYLKV